MVFSGKPWPWSVALVMAGGVSLCAGPIAVATSASAPSFQLNVGLATVVARLGKPVHFVQLLECYPDSACSDKDAFVVNGDRVVTGEAEGQRVYVWFRGRGKSLRGWLPAAHVKNLPLDTNPALEKWKGTWTVGDVRKIVIKVGSTAHQLTITGHAKWYGARLENGYQVIHTGDVRGKALPDGNRVIIRDADDSDCVLELELVDEFLAAEDNMHCGGMNVSFGDVYTRDTGIEKSTQ